MKYVLCPRCGLACTLTQLRRSSAYRLTDPDGHGHMSVCINAPALRQSAVRYRPHSGRAGS